jgi:hypothetical protein
MAAFPCCTDETRRPGMQARRSVASLAALTRCVTPVQRREQRTEGVADGYGLAAAPASFDHGFWRARSAVGPGGLTAAAGPLIDPGAGGEA